MKKLILLIAIVGTLFSCETTINPDLKEAEEVIVVDAWLNNLDETQIINLTRSQPYFENSAPEMIEGAEVSVQDLTTGETFEFIEGVDGYEWESNGSGFGTIGHIYRLLITVEGETFEAFSDMGDVPPIDSIKFNYNPADVFFDEEYYLAEFVATDVVGPGNTYWIKAYKNGEYLAKPNEINVAYDAGFSEGDAIDGQVFIQPIQDAINPFDEDPDDNTVIAPYSVGDSVFVEIHSINVFAFNFLLEIRLQMDRPGGFAELFATPLANASTNLVSQTEGSTTGIAGFFNVAAISSAGRTLTPELAKLAQELADE